MSFLQIPHPCHTQARGPLCSHTSARLPHLPDQLKVALCPPVHAFGIAKYLILAVLSGLFRLTHWMLWDARASAWEAAAGGQPAACCCLSVARQRLVPGTGSPNRLVRMPTSVRRREPVSMVMPAGPIRVVRQ